MLLALLRRMTWATRCRIRRQLCFHRTENCRDHFRLADLFICHSFLLDLLGNLIRRITCRIWTEIATSHWMGASARGESSISLDPIYKQWDRKSPANTFEQMFVIDVCVCACARACSLSLSISLYLSISLVVAVAMFLRWCSGFAKTTLMSKLLSLLLLDR